MFIPWLLSDRDRPFQERWHRKRERFAAAGRCHPAAHGFGGRRGPNSSPNRMGPRGPPGARGRRSCGPVGPGGRSSRVARAEAMDDALKEAIRRSLQDVNKVPVEEPKTIAPTKETDKPAPKETEKPAPSEEVEHSAPFEEPEPAAPVETEVKIKEPKGSESFSTDAIGNGLVAEVLGQTLDQCADAIDAMVKEMNRSSSESSSTKTEEKDESSKPDADDTSTHSGEEHEITVEAVADDDEPTEAEEATTAGATILESVGPNAAAADESSVKSQRSEDEWHVVSDDDDEKIDDEILARAAAVVGSALFDSDNFTRGDASSLSGGADASFISSVPTISSESNVPVAVLDLWAPHLIQLRELGFVDDAASVDVLERLQAANIGSDSFEDVSVERVVHELLKKH